MRKIIVLSFISLDGVMQAPGGPEEDTSGGFKYGGWTFPYFDDFSGKIMGKQMSLKFDLLLGRKTYDIFASYWPKHVKEWPQADKATKYVVSKTLKKGSWKETFVLKNVEDIKRIKKSKGPDLQVHGSGEMIQTLLKNDLVDELWLKFFPLTLGKGKKLFTDGAIPAAFNLMETKVTPSGVIFANYKRAGEIKTGTFV
jgi:dihydrofolate reductase